jgi:hypothetical protein
MLSAEKLQRDLAGIVQEGERLSARRQAEIDRLRKAGWAHKAEVDVLEIEHDKRNDFVAGIVAAKRAELRAAEAAERVAAAAADAALISAGRAEDERRRPAARLAWLRAGGLPGDFDAAFAATCTERRAAALRGERVPERRAVVPL